jgi:NADH-quinone oxidoreductase subunit L
MVTAGVFMVARLYPIYMAAPGARTFVAIIGGITLFIAGLLAVVQDDVKKVLAYSTISQLGYMVAALGFSYTAGIFHLFTHGFFKALLFLGAGSLIHSAHSNNMSDMGGMKKFMPITYWTFLVGSLALMALPPLAGFWSKDEILASANAAGTSTGNMIFGLGIVGGMITAFYMTRVLWLVFAGEFRGHGHPHESPKAMTVPLILLAIPAVLIGLWNVPTAGFAARSFAASTMFSTAYWAAHPAHFVPWIAASATGLGLIGIGVGTAFYRRGRSMADDPMLRMGPVSTLLVNKYYLDELYTHGVVRPVRDRLSAAMYWINDHVIDRTVYLTGVGATRLGKVTYDYADQKGIDGVVNGMGVGANWSGGLLKFAQSGNVQLYAGAMFVGVIVLGVLFAASA